MHSRDRSNNTEHSAKPLVITFNSFTLVTGTRRKYIDHRVVSTASILILHQDHQQ